MPVKEKASAHCKDSATRDRECSEEKISIAALHMVWQESLDQKQWMAAACFQGASSPATL